MAFPGGLIYPQSPTLIQITIRLELLGYGGLNQTTYLGRLGQDAVHCHALATHKHRI